MMFTFNQTSMLFLLFCTLTTITSKRSSAENIASQTEEDFQDIGTIYYDMNDHPVPKISTPVDVPQSLRRGALRYGWIPCTCQSMTCGCCSNININYLDFKRKGCMNFTYDPKEFALNMNVLMNEEPVYQNSISGKNPPPACIPFSPVAFLPGVEFCIRMYNIYMPGQNIHACVNLETQIIRVPLLVLQFDCFRLGADGFAIVKPNVENAGLPIPSMTSTMLPIEEPEPQTEYYDEVIEEKKTEQNETIH